MLPDDIYTESEASPDTLANLGPLRRLAGSWSGPKGRDINPKADGPEQRDYLERIDFVPIDPQPNGPQLFYGLRYHVHVNTPEESITFHDQVGYWLWEPATGLVLQSLAIPRGQVALAKGNAAPGDDRIVVEAARGSTENGIASTAFLEHAFRTDHYRFEIEFHGDDAFTYVSDTTLIVRGRSEPFVHRDTNRLTRIAGPVPNPLMQLVAKPEIR